MYDTDNNINTILSEGEEATIATSLGTAGDDLLITTVAGGVLVDFSGIVAGGGSMLILGTDNLDSSDFIFA